MRRILAIALALVFCLSAIPLQGLAALIGDVDGDGKVSDWDAILLNRYLAGWGVAIDLVAADVDGDGKVTDWDAILLERYLAGWDVVFWEPDPEETQYETFVYGYSELGRELVCHAFTPPTYEKTVLLNFTIHGFEDNYNHDGQVLTDVANFLIDYYQENDSLLQNTRLLIIPTANPDGLIDGYTQDGFGRCNANGVDLNRDFDVDHLAYPPGRNYTPYPFSAAESRALRDLVLEYNPCVVLDLHGWLNTTIGDSELAEVFRDELGIPFQQDFSSGSRGYFAHWAHRQGAFGLLVEFKNPNIDTTKLIKVINRILQDDYDNGQGVYATDNRFARFSSIGGYTLSTGRVTTYKGFNEPFDTTSYIDGIDLCTIQKIYANGWVKVSYPVTSGTKTAYCPLSEFINPASEVEHYAARVSANTTVYRRSDLSQSTGSVWTTDEFWVVAEDGQRLQILYPLDAGGWKMGWINKSAIVS
ncbi:MAG: dockerin type I domain-containing protein [Clostridiales bacterium]|nr:dockerin type I domain-containing protein [Clostridiales bacterium]